MRTSRAAEAALQPIVDVLDRVEARHGEAPVHGVAPHLVRPPSPFAGQDVGWLPATSLVDGTAIDEFLAAAGRRWPADPHVVAALAWKSYTYWVTLPTVIGFVAERVVPDVRPDNMQFQIHERPPFVAIRMLRPDATSLIGDAGLLAELRKGLLDEHFDPVLEQLRLRVHLGRRTLLGSVASAVCYAVVRAREALPDRAVEDVHRILDALGLSDLVDFGAGPDGELRVQRHTCCLAFALPTPKICSGCVLTTSSRS